MQLSDNLSLHLLKQHSHSAEARELSMIINQIVLGSKLISRDINRAGLANILGDTGQVNVQDEEVKKLDEITNQTFVELFDAIPQVGAYASEELAEIVSYPHHGRSGTYLVAMDPVDGSSNIDVNISVGTIFAIYRSVKADDPVELAYQQPAKNLVAAGYVLYGSSTIFVYSSGFGVHGFTLDPSLGEFLLSHPHLKFPHQAKYYSINEAYAPNWNQALAKYVTEAKLHTDNRAALNARYVGSLVADFHRNLLDGGIYIYPADKKKPEGKLRMLFEAAPLAFLAHQAGGAATNGSQPIMEITPSELHQRTPLIIGSKQEVEALTQLLQAS